MKNLAYTIFHNTLLALACIALGYYLHKPATKVVTKEIVTYDFTNNEQIRKAFLNTTNQVLLSMEEYSRVDTDKYSAAYQEGYRKGREEGFRIGYVQQ